MCIRPSRGQRTVAVMWLAAEALLASGADVYVDTWDGVCVALPYRATETVGEVKASVESCRDWIP